MESGERPSNNPQLDSMSRDQLEKLWDEADESNIGRAQGFAQGEISAALDRLNNRDQLPFEEPNSLKNAWGDPIDPAVLELRRERRAQAQAIEAAEKTKKLG